MKLGEAVSEGYTPCGICKPPELLGSPKKAAGAAAKAEDGLYRVSALKLSSYKEADTRRMARAKVVRHIDGDTVELRFENPPAGIAEVEKIRMIGVDTPETVHPKKEVEFFGKEASEFTKSALLYKDVFAAFDWDTRDRYGRLLVYIYTAPGVCHNAELVRQGFAHAYTRFPFQFLEEFRALEASAREARRGLWAN
jgi:micrococcal nuclease